MTTKNAAALLAELLDAYAVPKNTSPEGHRGFDNQEDITAWRDHNRACDLIRTVDYILTGMEAIGEDTTIFKGSLGRWYAGVHFAATPWGSAMGGARPACPDSDIKLLQALAMYLDATKPFRVDEDDRRTLSDVLNEASALLDEDSSDLPDDVRRYLHALIQRARMIVDNLDKYGHEAVRQVALELGGALTVQAERVTAGGDEAKGARWRSAAMQLMLAFVGGAAGGASQELTGEISRQLMTGGHH